MNEDRFNMDIRKFLKVVGVTSQREIETAVRDALAKGRLAENALLKPRVTMISTSKFGRARSALTQARAGGFSGSTQAFHTEFISANSAMSLIHRLADSRFDLLVPAWAR